MWAYLSTVCATIAVVAGYSLYVAAKEAAFAAGNQLADLAELTGRAEAIWFNGQRFHHAVVTTDLPLSQALDRFEAHCTKNPNFIGRALLDIPPEALAELDHPLDETFRHGVIREEGNGAGMVICFVDERPGGLGELTTRLERYLESGDLSEFGRVRYFHVRKTASGNTQVMTLWTDAPLDVNRMFPANGDAAGADPKAVPRAPNSRRILSAAAESMPYGVFVYESGDGLDAVRRFYDGLAKRKGWTIVENAKRNARGYVTPNGFQTFLSLSSKDGATIVTVIEAGDPSRGSTLTVRAELVK